MQKINFKNLPSTDTPINATNLNLMQDNIESAIEDVEDTIPTIENSLDSDSATNGASVHAVNEKFSAINNYSTSERIVGIYKDGKPIYKKTVYISSLPNAQQQGYAHNIPNIDIVVDAVAVAHTDNTTAHIPYIGVTSNLNIGMFANITEITFVVGADRTNWYADVDMYYTKTTD